MDDRRDRVEKGEMLHPRRLADTVGERRRGQRAGGDDGHALVGQRVDPLAHDLDLGMLGQGARDRVGKDMAVDGERGPGGHLRRLGARHDERFQPPHFLVQQADGILVGVIGPEAVGADQLGQPLGLVRRRHVPRAAHFRQANPHPRLRQLPRRFRPGEPAADNVDLMMGHGSPDLDYS